MSLHQAWNDRLSTQIDNLGIGTDVSLHTGLTTYIDQAVAFDRQRGGLGKCLIHSIDVSVAVYAVGSLCTGCHCREC